VFTGRVVGPGDPVWAEDDVDLALAWQAEQKAMCKGCGHHLDESTDGATRRQWEAQELICHGCEVIDLRRAALTEAEADMPGRLIYARKKTDHG